MPKFSRSLLHVLKRSFGYLRPYWKQTAGAYLTSLGILGLGALIPQFIRWIIDTGISSARVDILTWSVLGLLALTILKGFLNYFQGLFSETASQNVAFDLRNELQKKLTSLSFSFHDQSETGELLSRAIQDVERVRFLTGRASLRILEAVLMLLITAVIMLFMNVNLALLVMIAMPLLIFQAVRFGIRFRPLSLLVQKQLAVITTAVEQNLRGSRVVKTYTQEDNEITRFEKENNLWFSLSSRSAWMQAINQPLLFFISNVGLVVIILFGGYQVMHQQTTIGELVAFISYIGQLVDPVRRLGMIIPAVAIAGSASERIFDVLDAVSEVKDQPGAKPLRKITGQVKFDQVTFDYGSHRILKDISFTIEPGQRVALLGSTGSGKTSIINLIPRFYDPLAGRILLDGVDIRSITLKSLRKQIGIVLQESTLFAGTIRDNIAFGSRGATDESIMRAARAAQAHEFIMQSPQGYLTRVGEKGITLSGGQKQRLAIARVLLLDPRILIFDDATASVDTETEHQIQEALEQLVKGRTTFVIAHRISTVHNADIILLLENGRIAAMGKHEEMIANSPLYRTIYQQQLCQKEEGS